MNLWLRKHPEADLPGGEVECLSKGKPVDAIKVLYENLPEGDYKRGIKSPWDITNKGGAMDSIRTYWPQTKLIIGVRHPIRWFESFYNYRLQRMRMPHPNDLLKKEVKGFSVETGNFHAFLGRLGKTNMTAPEEIEMRRNFPHLLDPLPPPMANKVFLYDIEQVADTNETRSTTLRRDLQQFLELEEEIPPLTIHKNKGKRKPDKAYIDICEQEYDILRNELKHIAGRASIWIRKYFVEDEDVTVSSRDYLEEILQKWMYDPCDSVISSK